MKTPKTILMVAGLSMALVLAGCWGDDGDQSANGSNGSDTPGTVPDSASVSVKSFIDFILALGQNDETSDPLVLRDFSVPSDEMGDPQPLS